MIVQCLYYVFTIANGEKEATITYLGNLLGSGKTGQAYREFKVLLLLNKIECDVIACLVYFFRNPIADLFADKSSKTHSILVKSISAASWILSFNWTVARGACYALSIAKKQAPFSTLYVLLYVPLAYYLSISYSMNTVGLFIAIIAAVAMDSITYSVLLFKEDWK